MPILSAAKYITVKRGYDQRECEDAISINANRRSFCIADGATEGFASRYWARLLTKHWAQYCGTTETVEEFNDWAQRLGERFNRRWARRQLPWYAEEKARLGAFAAFAALWFFECGSQLRWKALAIGDACLVLLRRSEIARAFPVEYPQDFGFRPTLLPSNPTAQKTVLHKVEMQSGEALPGDSFFLLTDAIAAWFLQVAKHAPDEIARFDQLLDREIIGELDDFIEHERSIGSLRNDDVCVARIQIAI